MAYKQKGFPMHSVSALRKTTSEKNALEQAIDLQTVYKGLTPEEKKIYNTLSLEEKMEIKNPSQLKKALGSDE